MSWSKIALAASAAAQLTCHQVILTAPPGSTISLFANPPFIEANGGVSVISALVIEPIGTPVADGTVIQFFTTLGRIDEQAKTNDGVARVNFVSDSRSGTAVITAVSGGPASGGPAPGPSPTAEPVPVPGGTGTGTVQVIIGSAQSERVVVTADPNPIQTDGPRESVVSAFVHDANGNPIANIAVFFSFLSAPSTERLEAEGQPVFTDNNGRAQTVMRTQYPLSAQQKVVTVVATLATGESGNVAITINPGLVSPSPPTPPTSPTPSAKPASGSAGS